MSNELGADAAAIAKARIRGHEGQRDRPYRDSVGVWTVGIGRNLEAKPFGLSEIELMFANDFHQAVADAQKLKPWDGLDDARRGVLVEMCFQMGLNTVLKFQRFLDALEGRRYAEAARQMWASKWAEQAPARVRKLVQVITTGTYGE